MTRYIPLFYMLMAIELAGCAPNTEVVKVAPDTYTFTKQGGLEPSGTLVGIEVIKEAEQFCSKSNKKFAFISNTTQDKEVDQPASAVVQFKCERMIIGGL